MKKIQVVGTCLAKFDDTSMINWSAVMPSNVRLVKYEISRFQPKLQVEYYLLYRLCCQENQKWLHGPML